MNQQLLIIWSVLAISQVIYIFVPAPLREGSANAAEIFPAALGVVAFTEGLGVIVLLRVRAFNPIRRGRLDPASKEGAAQLFITLMLAWVLAESVAIYGLVVRFLDFDLPYSVPFSVGAALLMFLGRPWQSKLKWPSTTAEIASSGTPLN